jgi:cell shape-determining protein MreC
MDFTSRLRMLAGYHMGVDLPRRTLDAARNQREQAKALNQAADEIERLQRENSKLRGLCGIPAGMEVPDLP